MKHMKWFIKNPPEKDDNGDKTVDKPNCEEKLFIDGNADTVEVTSEFSSLSEKVSDIDNEKSVEHGLTSVDTLSDEIVKLRRENEELRREKATNETLKTRFEREITDFSELFPDVTLESVPDNVWEDVKRGIPLTAAYSRHETERKRRISAAEKVNGENAEKSSGTVKGGGNYYFSPSEVRAMPESEVRRNYAHVIESMKHWN